LRKKGKLYTRGLKGIFNEAFGGEKEAFSGPRKTRAKIDIKSEKK